MTDQLMLALADRRAGQEANLAAGITGHRDDTARVERAIAELVRRGEPFTSNDVHGIVGNDGGGPYDRNIVSSKMGTLARQGVIVHDWTRRPEPAKQRARKGSRNPYWVGNVNKNSEEAA